MSRGAFILPSFKSRISDYKLIRMDSQGYDLICMFITIGFLLFSSTVLKHVVDIFCYC